MISISPPPPKQISCVGVVVRLGLKLHVGRGDVSIENGVDVSGNDETRVDVAVNAETSVGENSDVVSSGSQNGTVLVDGDSWCERVDCAVVPVGGGGRDGVGTEGGTRVDNVP